MTIINIKTSEVGSSDLPVGTKMPIKVDISSTDFPITVPIRMITAITGTVILVDMECIGSPKVK